MADVVQSAKSSQVPRKFRGTLFQDIKPNLDEDWLIEDLAPATGVMFVYGDPSSGKTFLVLDAVLHVAAGRPWAGRKVRKGAAAYIAAEGGDGFRKRVAAARLAHSLPSDTPFALIAEAPNMGAKANDLDTLVNDVELILHQLKVPHPTLVNAVFRRSEGLRRRVPEWYRQGVPQNGPTNQASG